MLILLRFSSGRRLFPVTFADNLEAKRRIGPGSGAAKIESRNPKPLRLLRFLGGVRTPVTIHLKGDSVRPVVRIRARL